MKLLHRPNLLRIMIGCVVGIAAVFLEGVWLNSLDEALAGKLVTTFAIIAAVAGLAYAAAANIEADTKHEKDRFLD
jgi:hypothetical protein